VNKEHLIDKYRQLRESHTYLVNFYNLGIDTMLKLILILMVLAIVAVLIFALRKPNTFHVERSIDIKATPEKIFSLINDFHQWALWTPYDKDPSMKKTYGGSASGKGATYAWEGNKEVGQGNITITDTATPNKVVLDLNFIRPFEGAHNLVVFTLDSSGDFTKVMWAMDGESHFMFKVMGLFIDMDNMIGKDFAAGLAKMKIVAESN
jgi:uncharacterized protein YndB with AHSA1/START domain